MNQELINNILQNKKSYIRPFQGRYPAEIIEDAFQETILQFLNKTYIVESNNYRAYFQIALRTFIYQHANKSKRLQSIENEAENDILSMYNSTANEVCYYDMIETEQHKQYQLRRMHGYISDLTGKQKEAVISVLERDGSTTDPNFKQAIKKLRLAMGGKLFKINSYAPTKNITGKDPYLTKEAVINIRNNVKRNNKGIIINLKQLSEQHKVSKDLVKKVIRNLNYKGK